MSVDSGLRALCGVAGYYRIPADPEQLSFELALQSSRADSTDLVRAANRIGLKARILTDIGSDRLASIPKPALLKLRSGDFVILGGCDPAGRWRLIDPVTYADRYLERDSLCAEIEPLAILVGRRLRGPGIDPRNFGFRWFLPSIWRYRKPLMHVLLASLFIQVFALVTPLFFQVIVDKVLAHNASFRPT
jgi:subfamily B ATP-binding cassette protein HlyB/CyaB